MADSSPNLGMDDLQLSDTAILVDPEDLATVDEKQEVAIADPDILDLDDADADMDMEPILRADDCAWLLTLPVHARVCN